MPSIINSDDGQTSGSAGLKFTSADDGVLQIQNNSVDAITVASSGQATFAAPVSQPGAFMFRNKIINGNFELWQRGTSQTISGYDSVDRWLPGHLGSTKTASRQSFDLGQTEVPNNPRFFMRHEVTSSAGAGNFVSMQHRIEAVETLAGKTATLSFWAKADASKNIAVEFQQNFGSGGSPSSTVEGIGSQKVALTTSWTKYTITVDIPSISGKTLGSNGDDYLRITFWFDAGSDRDAQTDSLGQQSGTFDIAQVQLEEGAAATPFELRPLMIEQQLCYRYYVWNLRVSGAGQITGANQTDRSLSSITFPSPVRSYSAQISYTHVAGTNLSSTWSVVSQTNNGCTMRYPGGSSTGASGSTYWHGYITVDDEL